MYDPVGVVIVASVKVTMDALVLPLPLLLLEAASEEVESEADPEDVLSDDWAWAPTANKAASQNKRGNISGIATMNRC